MFVNPSRPKFVDEVAFQEEVVSVLKKSLEGADVSVRDWRALLVEQSTIEHHDISGVVVR